MTKEQKVKVIVRRTLKRLAGVHKRIDSADKKALLALGYCWCAHCRQAKPLTEFSNSGAFQACRCRPCDSARNVEAYRNPRVKQQRKDYRLRVEYGWTRADYDAELKRQDGKCAICGSKAGDGGRPLAVDHDHTTGKVRGLLCDMCNRGIGHLRDDPLILLSAIDYLVERRKRNDG